MRCVMAARLRCPAPKIIALIKPKIIRVHTMTLKLVNGMHERMTATILITPKTIYIIVIASKSSNEKLG